MSLFGGSKTYEKFAHATDEEVIKAGGIILVPSESTGRNFESGAYRDGEEGKHDFEGFMSPPVLERYAEYMTKHRVQSNGVLRDSDNWQKGIPKEAYMKSGWRHFFDWWKEHRGFTTKDGIEDALCALIFNAMGYLHELSKDNT